MVTKKQLLEAKKLLEAHAPKGEFLAYINKDEAQVLKNLGGSGRIVEATQIPSYEVTQTQALPPQYVEDLQRDLGTQLTALTAAPLATDKFAPQVAGQDQAQRDAYTMATTQGQGIGAFQPYITQAGAYDQAAAGSLGQAAGALGQAGQFGTAAGGFSGPQGYQGFMSPYQQDVIDATLKEYDSKAAAGLAGIGQQAAMSGNLGGGREGVMRSQYQNKSDMNRALLQSGLLQQGFTQANQLANQAFNQQSGLANLQMGIGQGQMGIGQAQQGLSRNQQSLASQVPGLYGQDIGTLGSVGAIQQAQEQAGLDAVREQNRLRAYEPYERLGFQQTGVASIASGAPGQYRSTVTPNPTPLQNALGIAGVAGGLMGNYGDFLRGQNTTQAVEPR